MGLYDYLAAGPISIFKLAEFLPNRKIIRQYFIENNYFQTKSFANCMSSYLLGDDGQLYLTDDGIWFFSEEEVPRKDQKTPFVFTGEINFYTEYAIKRDYWVDYFLKIKDGKFDLSKIKCDITRL